MFILKHLKTLQHISIIIQIIFRELVCYLLKSLILKFVKNVTGLQHTSPHRTHAHIPNVMLPHHHIDFLTNFKINDFNKEHNELPEDDLNDDRNMLRRF